MLVAVIFVSFLGIIKQIRPLHVFNIKECYAKIKCPEKLEQLGLLEYVMLVKPLKGYQSLVNLQN